MKREEVRAFFDRLAPSWDVACTHDPETLGRILAHAGVGAGARVLDVACGTGVLFPHYFARGVSHVTGVDLSPAMIARAREKFPHEPRLTLLAQDVMEAPLAGPFDVCMVYSALPHFPDPAALAARLCGLLAPGGRLCVAHSQGRAAINARHQGGAAAVSMGLMPAAQLAALLPPPAEVTACEDDGAWYCVVARMPA